MCMHTRGFLPKVTVQQLIRSGGFFLDHILFCLYIITEFSLLPQNKAAEGENSFSVSLIRQQEKTKSG